jgi:WD40-like Beta Propeller Repeat
MRVVIAAAAVLLMAGCQSGQGPTASAPRTAVPSSTPTEAPSPTAATFASQLNCNKPVTATHGLALYEYAGASVLVILDVSDPLKPTLLCWLSGANGGRFDQAPNQIVFWTGNKLGAADLTSGKVVQTDTLPAAPVEGSFSGDGAQFAYRTGDNTVTGMSLHLYRRANHRDITLYSQDPIGGHGGAPFGPLDQLIFSPDNKLLLDYYDFRPSSGTPPRFMLFRTADGSIAYQLETAAFGAWAPTGSTMYFFVQGEQGFIGELDSVGASGQTQTVVTSINGFFWPSVTPDGTAIVYASYDSAGLPHIMRLDLATHAVAEFSTAISSKPVFVTRTVLWSDEEKPCDCGLGGQSAPDGAILAHNLSGTDTPVDTSHTAPGVGAPQPTATGILDVWY